MEESIASPPTSHVHNVWGAAYASLPAAERRLLELLGPRNFLGWATVARGERAAGRLVVARAKAADVVARIEAEGTPCRRARFDMVEVESPVSGTVHAGRRVERDSVAEGRAVVVLGRDAEFLDGVELAESHDHHDLLGQLLGYPACCVDFYRRHTALGHDLTPASIGDPGPHPRLLNPLLAHLFELPLLFHFPCSPRCAESRQLATGRADYLRRLDPGFEELFDLARGLALYGPELGMVQIPAAGDATGPDGTQTLSITAVMASSEDVRRRLASTGPPWELRVEGPHRFRFGPWAIDDPQSFVARFD